MKHCVIACALAVAASAQGQGTPPDSIRYEFGIRVVSNTVATNGVGGDLAALAIGEEGVFTVDVNPDGSIYLSDDPEHFQAYQVLDLGVQIGAIGSGATPGVYPSGPSFSQGFWVENDKVIGGGLVSDSLAMIPSFASPELGFSAFGIFHRVPGGQNATMLSGIELPLSIDTSLITSPIDFSISSPHDGGATRVSFDVFSATVTVIPAPGSAALLALASLAAPRRKR